MRHRTDVGPAWVDNGGVVETLLLTTARVSSYRVARLLTGANGIFSE